MQQFKAHNQSRTNQRAWIKIERKARANLQPDEAENVRTHQEDDEGGRRRTRRQATRNTSCSISRHDGGGGSRPELPERASGEEGRGTEEEEAKS